MDTNKMAEELGVDPEKIDFTLSNKELEQVSGGGDCGSVGQVGASSKTGVPGGCTEIGYANPECTKAGM
ncbi:MAG: bacteriocin [Bacteroidetes bacterium]|nr:bacteriocin [Bacteroidota bacterium]